MSGTYWEFSLRPEKARLRWLGLEGQKLCSILAIINRKTTQRESIIVLNIIRILF